MIWIPFFGAKQIFSVLHRSNVYFSREHVFISVFDLSPGLFPWKLWCNHFQILVSKSHYIDRSKELITNDFILADLCVHNFPHCFANHQLFTVMTCCFAQPKINSNTRFGIQFFRKKNAEFSLKSSYFCWAHTFVEDLASLELNEPKYFIFEWDLISIANLTDLCRSLWLKSLN